MRLSAGDEELLRDLLAGCAILDGEGLTGAFGHLSVVLDDSSVLVTSNAGPGLVHSVDDLIRVDREGQLLEGDPGIRPGELAIHLGLLAGEWRSVARFHGPAVLAWGALGRPLPAALGVAMFCGASIPCFDTATTVTTSEQAEALTACVDGGPAVILRGFGAATTGRTVAEAVGRAWLLERAAAATLSAEATGHSPRTYTEAQAAPFVRSEGPAETQIGRLWRYLASRHM